ncbi:MFS polyamine transporter [Rickenella mellea]|uniref:MFS polyamine transporter n=1 Tax=Rickenella mellea TaxID=50990 RepID=A0A4Y7PDY8_9AGAM|nr:MFS polyamine transporter [Rickenella mellea]
MVNQSIPKAEYSSPSIDTDHPKALETGEYPKNELILVDWEGPDDMENPKNWTFKEKWILTVIVSTFTFISPVSSSMIAPASDKVALDFGTNNGVVIAMITSVFVLAYALGPLVLGPLSEIYGRSRVLQGANFFYLVWNIACGFSQNTGQLIAFRFLAGLGGSAPFAVGAGVLGDCWKPEERGQAIAVYSFAPILGPVVGPVIGAWIADRTTWRWVFWSTSIADGVVQILGFIFLRETYAPLLLERKSLAVKQSLGISSDYQPHIKTIYQISDKNWQAFFAKSIVRPFTLFVCEPIIQVLGIYMAFVYGLLYLMLTSIPSIFRRVYEEPMGVAGFHYFALGIGSTVASLANARLSDRTYIHFKEKHGGVGKPEFRLVSMVLGSVLFPLGLFIAGWCAEQHIHWIVTDLGILFIGAGIILIFQSVQAYMIDSFTLYAASAMAAVVCLRSLTGFGFPLFAPAMYRALGYGKGDTILATFGILIGCPAPWLFWHYGERLRQRSRYTK